MGEPVRASSSGEKRQYKTSDVLHKQRTGDLAVPFAEISTMEGIVTGFRMQMFDLHDDAGNEVGSMSTGSGLGSDFITISWGERTAVVRGIDLLRAWVQTFDAKTAGKLPEGLK